MPDPQTDPKPDPRPDPKPAPKASAGRGSSWRPLLRFWSFVRPHRRWLYLGLAMIPLVAGMAALRPLLLKEAVDVDIANRDILSLRVTALLFMGAVAAEFLAQAVQVYALQRTGHTTIADLRRSVFRHILRLPARFFDNNPIGALLSRSTTDVEALSETLGATVAQLFGREAATGDEYQRLGGRYLKATKTANIYDALLYSLMDGISALSIAMMIYFGAPGLTQANGLTLGLIFAFVDYLQRLFVPIREFSGKLAVIQRALAALDRIYGLLDEPAEPRADGSRGDPLASWRGGIEVRDLRFRYREGGPDILKGISFDLAPGEVVAVVGRTGSGKTSLGRVLTRSYDGYRGSVSLQTAEGPVEVDSVPPDLLRRHALMVQQDVFLFSDDVAFNVSLGDPPIAGEARRIDDALATVQATAFVQERGGLDFEIGERGRNLSAGEAQLVAFARVAAREPQLLILDEATASVDSLTENKVQRAIEELFRGRSVLVIAHRLSTVRRADKILVMDAGTIAEFGDHDTLMAKGGIYADLYHQGLTED